MGREIAWSRAVCRVNRVSDIEAGIGEGTRLFTRVSAQPEFEAELEAARAEVAAARAEGLTHPSCAAERSALRQWSAPAARPDAG